MSKIESSSRNKAVSAELPSRPKHGHRPPEACSPWQGAEAVDPHSNWLKKWRSLRTGFGGGRISDGSADLIKELQNKIAHTPAGTIAGLQAQAELISELAWNDVVAATARRLVAGLKRLHRSNAGSP
ncbi:MAG: hypothetical protein ACR2RF_07350 [Geminicoccaceae bacterium]